MNILTAQEVKNKITQNPEIKLIMTLSPIAYQKCHIPNSLNVWDINLAKAQFSKETEIIVYCSDKTCMASFYAYQQLEEEGYQKIWRFAGGLVEWEEMGFDLVESPS